MANHAHNQRADFKRIQKPLGVITRGTTNTNRLRRCDRWLLTQQPIVDALNASTHPQAIDLGYGASATTTVEWASWLRRICPHVKVLGLEIDPSRVLPPQQGVEFALGGFELAGHRPTLVRAFNVLRQYDAAQVEQAWTTVCSRLAPSGFFIEGTCDELGRRASWITLTADGPQALSLAWDPFDVERPSMIAERLPKALIHQNVPGTKIYAFLQLLDRAWDHSSSYATFGPRAQWRAARRLLEQEIAFCDHNRRAYRDNRLTVPWSVVN